MKEKQGQAQDAGRRVWPGLALAVLLDTVVPLVWKAGVMRLPADAGGAALARATLHQPLFWLLAVLFAAQFFNWMAVLSASDVSYAQPITALSYVAVSVLSTALLGERFSVLRGAGVGLILAGVWLIGTTPARTAPRHPVAARRTPGGMP